MLILFFELAELMPQQGVFGSKREQLVNIVVVAVVAVVVVVVVVAIAEFVTGSGREGSGGFGKSNRSV